MKIKLLIFILLAFSSTCIIFSGCSKEKDVITEKNTIHNEQEIISPSGKLIAKSLATLEEILQPSIFNLFKSEANFKIIKYDFLETDFETAVIIDVENTEHKTGRVIFIKEFSSSILRADDKCYTISCSGDCICPPTATISNGQVSTSCPGDCQCNMTVKEHECK